MLKCDQREQMILSDAVIKMSSHTEVCAIFEGNYMSEISVILNKYKSNHYYHDSNDNKEKTFIQ